MFSLRYRADEMRYLLALPQIQNSLNLIRPAV